MSKERLTTLSQYTCNHAKQKHYKVKRFDILNGFELVSTKCDNCHKTLAMEIKKFL